MDFDTVIDVFLYRDEGAGFAAGKYASGKAAAGHRFKKFIFQLHSSKSGE